MNFPNDFGQILNDGMGLGHAERYSSRSNNVWSLMGQLIRPGSSEREQKTEAPALGSCSVAVAWELNSQGTP